MSQSRNQLAGTLLLIGTVAAVICAVLSFQHLRSYPLHDDGVSWVDRKTASGAVQVIAAHVTAGSAGDHAGIKIGDQLVSIHSYPIHNSLDVPEALWRIPLLGQTKYTLRRNNIEFQKDNIFIQAAPRDSAVYYQYAVGAAYLAIGLFVYYRRTSAAKSLHFFILCLVSFIGTTFHYSGKLNTFDEVMYWGNLAATIFAPAIFLDFCLTFHARPKFLEARRSEMLLYFPSALIFLIFVGSAEGILKFSATLFEVRWFLDRLSVAFSMLLYFAGAGVLGYDYSNAQDPVMRRQLKYLRNGAFVGLLPFALVVCDSVCVWRCSVAHHEP